MSLTPVASSTNQPQSPYLSPVEDLKRLAGSPRASFEEISSAITRVEFGKLHPSYVMISSNFFRTHDESANPISLSENCAIIQFDEPVKIASPEFMQAVVNFFLTNYGLGLPQMKLVNCCFQDSAWESLIHSLSVFLRLDSLTFERCSLSEDQLYPLFMAINQTRIEKLGISKQEFCANELLMLCEGLRISSLKELTFNDDNITNDQFEQILPSLRNNYRLSSLNLSGNQIIEDRLQNLICPPNLTHLDFGKGNFFLSSESDPMKAEIGSQPSKKRKREEEEDGMLALSLASSGFAAIEDSQPAMLPSNKNALENPFSHLIDENFWNNLPLELLLQTESPSTRPEQKKEEWEDKMDLLEKDFKTASIPTQEHIQSLMDLKTDEKAIKDIDKRRIFEDRIQALFERLLKKCFSIQNIPSDGNCFFGSIWEGFNEVAAFDRDLVLLQYMGKNRKDFQDEIKNYKNLKTNKDKYNLLRAIVVHYIKKHSAEFQSFIAEEQIATPSEVLSPVMPQKMDNDGDVDMKAKDAKCEEPTPEKDSSVLEEKRVDQYCKKMKQDGEWAGDVEISALLDLFKEENTPISLKIYDLSMPPCVVEGKIEPRELLNRMNEGCENRVIHLMRRNQNHYQLLGGKSPKGKKAKTTFNSEEFLDSGTVPVSSSFWNENSSLPVGGSKPYAD
jgi:hypothetical protein